MKEMLERIWNEHFAEECAIVDSEEERGLAKRALEMHNIVNEQLTQESIENYIEAICELHSLQIKKAFFKGCGFASAFLIGVGLFDKN